MMSVCSYSPDDSNNMENDDFNSSGCGDMSFEMSGDTAEDLNMSPQHARKLNFSRYVSVISSYYDYLGC